MNKLRFALRVAAYTFGLIGLGLVLSARSHAEGGRQGLFTGGGVALGLMFVCFLATYALNVAAAMQRRRGHYRSRLGRRDDRDND